MPISNLSPPCDKMKWSLSFDVSSSAARQPFAQNALLPRRSALASRESCSLCLESGGSASRPATVLSCSAVKAQKRSEAKGPCTLVFRVGNSCLIKKCACADVFFLSAAAKLGATVVTYPLLLVKSRLMSAGKHTSSDRKYTGTLDAIERIYKTEGDPADCCKA